MRGAKDSFGAIAFNFFSDLKSYCSTNNVALSALDVKVPPAWAKAQNRADLAFGEAMRVSKAVVVCAGPMLKAAATLVIDPETGTRFLDLLAVQHVCTCYIVYTL